MKSVPVRRFGVKHERRSCISKASHPQPRVVGVGVVHTSISAYCVPLENEGRGGTKPHFGVADVEVEVSGVEIDTGVGWVRL